MASVFGATTTRQEKYMSIENHDFTVPLQGSIRLSKSDRAEYIQIDLIDGSKVIIPVSKDGFFREDIFPEFKRYALNMRRLMVFLEERATKDVE
jgi:hypothetical protein